MNKTLIRIQEVDGQGIPVPETSREYYASVVNVRDVCCRVPSIEETLKEFGSHIDEKASLGINTTPAETKYTEAKEMIENAKAIPSTRYYEAFKNLDSAQKAIDDGEHLLDQAWAEKEVRDAQERVDKADAIIDWFHGNKSTADDPGLNPIIAKREIAVNDLSAANEDITNGNYAQARSKAQDAFQEANESYNDAVIYRMGITCCYDPFKRYGTQFIVAGIGVIALLIMGIYLWKKHKQ
jgi:hypothetical protein